MTTKKKKRIHELAKELGLSAQVLVTKLQALGFSDVKGPQSALDEFTLLRVQGTLEAYGIVAKPNAPEATSQQSGGLTLRKKKKRTSVDSAPDAEDEPAPEAEPSDVAATNIETAAGSAPSVTRAPKTEPPAELITQSPEQPRSQPARPAEPAAKTQTKPVATPERTGEAERKALESAEAEQREAQRVVAHAQTVEELPASVYVSAPDDVDLPDLPELAVEDVPEVEGASERRSR